MKFLIFGVTPSRIETGYGYLKIKKTKKIKEKIVNVIKFIEKPSLKKLKNFFNKFYLWNSGLILFNSKTLINYHSVNNGHKVRLLD